MTQTAIARRAASVLIALAVAWIGQVFAQAPPEIGGVRFDEPATLGWDAVGEAEFYNVYRGTLLGLRTGDAARCHGYDIAGTDWSTPAAPAAGAGYFYLVTGESTTGGEGTPGLSGGAERPLRGACTPVMRGHVLDRIGFGWGEWTADRVQTLGVEGFVDEQLTPILIPEDPEFISRIAPYDPPLDILGLIGRQVIGGVYSRQQLSWQLASFWSNHFNTDWTKLVNLLQGAFPPCQAPGDPPQCDPNYPAKVYEVVAELQHRETSRYTTLSLRNGSFRELLTVNAASPAMILYLDTYTSIAGNPNENYPRELMELYVMGVDGGYTQQDVEELSRVFTGWTLCKKALADVGDPLSGCIEQYWLDFPAGQIEAHFVPAWHDCTQKILFAGTPQQAVIPDTCGNLSAGVADVALALDALDAHPSTGRFIVTKLLERFVTDEPEEALVDDIVAVWNDTSNPNGRGDLSAVMRALLQHPAFLDPDRVGSKIKTPLEHFISAIRAVGGTTDGLAYIVSFLVFAQHVPHYNPVPTGYPEAGDEWLGTNNALERKNFGLALALLDLPEFGSDPIAELAANGVPTSPGHAEEIVDFFAERLFGQALNPDERQAAVDYLNTDASGAPAPYDAGRIRETVGFLLGYPQFQEQ